MFRALFLAVRPRDQRFRPVVIGTWCLVQERLSMLFSATLSFRVTELAYEHMNNPQIIRINPEQVTAERITQTLYHVSNEEKIPLLIGLLQKIDPKRTIVFVNTKRTAEKVWGYLEGNA